MSLSRDRYCNSTSAVTDVAAMLMFGQGDQSEGNLPLGRSFSEHKEGSTKFALATRV